METSDQLQSEASVGMSTIVLVQNRCQFCYAFFKDPDKIVEHSQRCEFRFSETFEAADGKVKFACAVCFDVFPTRATHRGHEQLHKFPGGFSCTICDRIFLNGLECEQHTASDHEEFSSKISTFPCLDCGACFQQESYLRLHIETRCGRQRSWKCIQCGPNLLTEDAYSAHMEIEHNCILEEEDASVVPKVEVILTVENVIPDVNMTDPLHLVMKNEIPFFVDAQQSQIIQMDEEKDNLRELLAGQTSSEIPIDQSAPTASFGEEYIPKIGLGERYQCSSCVKKFRWKSSLDEHAVVHGPDGSLVHRCDCCGVYFKTLDDRAAHTTTVHKDIVTCSSCDKSFRSVKALQNHCNGGCPKECKKVEKGDESGEGEECAAEENSNAWVENETKKRNASDDSMSSDDEMDRISDNVRQPRRVSKKPRRGAHEKRFVCKYCGQRYFAEIRLKRHIIDHGPDGSLLHKCECCPIYFKTAEERDVHTAAEHNETFVCEFCEKSFRSLKSLQWHNYLSHKDRVEKIIIAKVAEFKCKYCDKKYLEKKGLDIHTAEHGPDGSLLYRCEFSCPIYFKTKQERVTHALDVHKEKLTCNVCGKIFKNKHSLYHCGRTHRNVPAQKYSFVCPKCGMSFGNKTYLNNHEKSDCGRAPIYKCDECGKTLAAKHSLKKHMMIHTGERNFPCSFCDMRLTDKISLRTHIRYRHTGERPHKCPYCEKRFVDNASMKTHTIVHTGIKRYVCYGCGDRFPSNSSLHKHRNARKDSCALVPIQPPLPLEGES